MRERLEAVPRQQPRDQTDPQIMAATTESFFSLQGEYPFI